jgi:hypothetical protein
MRKTPIVLVVAAFALWFVWKGKPYLDAPRPEVFSTPTVQPTNAAELGDARVKRKGQICASGIDYGPGARYVMVTVLTDQPAGPLHFAARAPGYAADADHPAGAGSNQALIVPIKPATREVGGGTLCITNRGKHSVGFFSVGANGPQGTASQTTVDGKLVPLDLSITLLTSPSRSVGDRLGTIFGHMAAFNPLSGWTVWVLFLLLLIGVPIALGIALGRALADDDEDASGEAAAEPREARGGW